MSDASSIESRFKRPELERSEPRRNFSGVFGPVAPPAAAADGVARGVDLGYRVIDDYLRQGQNFARNMFDRPGAEPGAASNDPQRLAERMLHYASDLAAAWFEYVRVIGASAGARPPDPSSAAVSGRAGPFDIESPLPDPATEAAAAAPVAPSPAPAEPATATRIALALASKQPTEVVVELKPGSAGLALSAHDLRAREPNVPRIAGVLIASDSKNDLVTIQITVPDDQPAATYHGIILDDATNLPRGTLSLRISA
jgi:hypothetical protein